MPAWKDELIAARDDAIAKIRAVITGPAEGDYELNGKKVNRSAYLKALWEIVRDSTAVIGDGFEFFEEHTSVL